MTALALSFDRFTWFSGLSVYFAVSQNVYFGWFWFYDFQAKPSPYLSSFDSWFCCRFQDSVLRIYTPEEVVVQCSVTNLCVLITNSFYLTLLVLCAVYTFKTRKLPKQFRETKGLALTIYSAATLHLIILSVVCTMDEQNLVRGRAVKLSHPLAASVVLFPIFLPKLYSVIYRKKKMVNKIERKKCSFGNVVTDGCSLRISQSTPVLLRRRIDSGTSSLHLAGVPDDSTRSNDESLATLSEDSRSKSTDTLRSNIGMLDRYISRIKPNRKPERRDHANHSIYSTWL